MSKKMARQQIHNLVLAAMFLAVGIVLPFFTGQIPQIGRMLLPMHLPVLLCGLICGWQCVISLYRSLLIAMVGGRLVWAAVRVIMTGVAQVPFTWEIFVADAFLSAIPGIILQLVFIPALMVALDRTGLVHFHRERTAAVSE